MSQIEFIGKVRGIEKSPLEIVERKGIGHPDTLADGVAETISNTFALECLEKYGTVLHHNLDKVYLTGGLVEVEYGSGHVVKPAHLYIGGRMSTTFGGKDTGAYELAAEVGRSYVHNILPVMDETDLRVMVLTNDYSHYPNWFHPRSLDDISDATDPRANDTSTTVGCWPISSTEELSLALEGYFYNPDGTPRFPDVGQDIKVMSKRFNDDVHATVNVPILGQFTASHEEYLERIEQIQLDLNDFASKVITADRNVTVTVNPGNRVVPYLLYYGSCIEAGEEGFVGRGNKLHGVISSIRPISMEAPHGKNPQYFNGKIHMFLATQLAKILSQLHEDATVNTYVSTSRGDKIREPELVAVESSAKIGRAALKRAVEQVFSMDYRTEITSGYYVPQVHSAAK